MPLIVLTGIPCSGKTTRARELFSYLQGEGHSVHLVGEETSELDKNSVYADAKSEKLLRGTFLSEVERLVSPQTFVICDSLNYIKGYRYELYCRARSQKTTSCVVYCAVSRERAREWNSKNTECQQEQSSSTSTSSESKSKQWNSSLLEELADRMEVPNARQRWDRPLFTLSEEDETPLQAITGALLESAPPTVNPATEYNKIEEPNFLYEVDQQTQRVISTILEAQNLGVGEVAIPDVNQKVTMPELRNLRRQFIKVSSLNSTGTAENITQNFVSYLNTNL